MTIMLARMNVPARLVAHMREVLVWDVFFVLEEPDLRRAPDLTHFRLAQQMRRTLITLDRDYLDDRRFPPEEGAGVLVLSAPTNWVVANGIDAVTLLATFPVPKAAS